MLDLNFLKGILDRFTDKNPNFLVIEVVNHYLQITLLKADFLNKEIFISKNWLKEINNLEPDYLLKEIKKLLKRIKNHQQFNVILNLDSNLALTVYSSVSLVRSKPKEVIDEADLDNLISQAIWRFFDKQRPRAAKKMRVEEIDVLLSDVRIRGIKVDGHKVVNPLGFKAKSVEIYLSETFGVRDFIKGIRDIMPSNKIVFVSEAGTTLSHVVLNSLPEHKSLFLVNLFPNQTSIVHASTGKLNHIDSFEWGESSFLKNLQSNFKLDDGVSRTIIDIYNKNKASPYLTKRLENIFIEECQFLANGIESLAPESGKIIINSYFNLPSCIVSDRFESKFNKNFKVQLLSTDSIMKNLGFTVQFSRSVKNVKNLATLYSVLIELSLIPKNEKISYLANRRVRWLLS